MMSALKNSLCTMKWPLLFIFLFIASSFGVYNLFSWIWGNDIFSYLTSMPMGNDKISAMSEAGSAIIGYSLAFAGAFTTIILAFLGARLAFLGHKLAMGERIEYLNDKYENVSREYSNAITALVHAIIIYRTVTHEESWDISPETGYKIQLKESATLTDELRASHKNLIARLLEFVTAIEQLGMNPLAQAMFRRLVNADSGERKSAILKAQTQFYKILTDMPQRPFATSFFEWSALMRTRLYLMRKKDPLQLAKERNVFLPHFNYKEHYDNFCEFNAEKYIPKYIEDILGLGYYLDFRIYNNDSCGIINRLFAHSGAAFICDLALMYPNNETLKAIFKEAFPSHKDCENELGFTFSLENAFPIGFMESVRSMETFAGEVVSSEQEAGVKYFPKA